MLVMLPAEAETGYLFP